jgi:hypothetical protein
VQDDRVVGRAETDDLHHARDRADVVNVLESRLIDVGVALADDADDGAVLAEEILHQADAARPAHVDRNDARGKNDAVPQRQDRQTFEIGARFLTHDRRTYPDNTHLGR